MEPKLNNLAWSTIYALSVCPPKSIWVLIFLFVSCKLLNGCDFGLENNTDCILLKYVVVHFEVKAISVRIRSLMKFRCFNLNNSHRSNFCKQILFTLLFLLNLNIEYGCWSNANVSVHHFTHYTQFRAFDINKCSLTLVHFTQALFPLVWVTILSHLLQRDVQFR